MTFQLYYELQEREGECRFLPLYPPKGVYHSIIHTVSNQFIVLTDWKKVSSYNKIFFASFTAIKTKKILKHAMSIPNKSFSNDN